jgi:lipopolysaccharide transport system ATP-binding protein
MNEIPEGAVGVFAENIMVEFPIYNAGHRSLKRAVLQATTGGRVARDSTNRVTVRALDGISFRFAAGERVGLMGHNGSGKTTLLRVLSGIYEPIEGHLAVAGRVASLLDLSLGIDQEASGYENIMLRAMLAGLTPKEVKAKMDEIANFTELGDYLEMPVRTYSSGMQLRLAFAVSTSIDADILVMDEWLSVGDAEFSKKASERLEKLVKKTPVLVLASHSRELIEKVCNRVIRLDHGKIVEDRRMPGPTDSDNQHK